MLFYRAALGEGVTVLGVSGRVRPSPAGLGRPMPAAPCRVTVRYAGQDGVVRTHRGLLWAAGMGERLVPVACQYDGAEVLLSLQPERVGGRRAREAEGLAVSDRFRAPFRLQSWGVVAVRTLQAAVRVRAGHRGGGLVLWGSVALTLDTGGARFRLSVPFCRAVAAPQQPGLTWSAVAGVAGVQLQVRPGGLVEGEAVVVARCVGLPRGRGSAAPMGAEGGAAAAARGPVMPQPAMPPGPAGGAPPLPADLARIRSLVGQMETVKAEWAGPGCAVVRGTLNLDLYWVDAEGRGRWAGRSVHVSALVDLPGARESDRLEAGAAVERLTHRTGDGGLWADLHARVWVTALRSVTVPGPGATRYRLQQVVAEGAGAVSVSEPLFAGARPDRSGAPGTAAGPAVEAPADGEPPLQRRPPAGCSPVSIPLPAPPGGWTELKATATVQPSPDGGWRLQVRLDGAPAGEAGGPVRRTADARGPVPDPSGEELSLLPALTGIDPGGVRAGVLTAPGAALPAPQAPAAAVALEGALDLPGAVRAILHAEALVVDSRTVRVRAVIAVRSPRQVRLAEGLLRSDQPLTGLRPVHTAVHPVEEDGRWRLHVTVRLAEPAS